MGNVWTKLANKFSSETLIPSMAVYNGILYGGSGTNGLLLRYDPINKNWVQICAKLGTTIQITSLCVFNGLLYASCGVGTDGGRLMRLNDAGNGWVQVCPKYVTETVSSSLYVFNGKLYGSTSPHGYLVKLNDAGTAWDLVCSQYLAHPTIRFLLADSNKLYAVTNNLTSTPGDSHGALLRLNSNADGWDVMNASIYGTVIPVAFFKYRNYFYVSGTIGTGSTSTELVRMNLNDFTGELVCTSYNSGTTTTVSAFVYNDRIYAGESGSGGRLLRLNNAQNGWDLRLRAPVNARVL